MLAGTLSLVPQLWHENLIWSGFNGIQGLFLSAYLNYQKTRDNQAWRRVRFRVVIRGSFSTLKMNAKVLSQTMKRSLHLHVRLVTKEMGGLGQCWQLDTIIEPLRAGKVG